MTDYLANLDMLGLTDDEIEQLRKLALHLALNLGMSSSSLEYQLFLFVKEVKFKQIFGENSLFTATSDGANGRCRADNVDEADWAH